ATLRPTSPRSGRRGSTIGVSPSRRVRPADELSLPRSASYVAQREVDLDSDTGVDAHSPRGDFDPEVTDVDSGRTMDAVLTRLLLFHPIVDGAGPGDAMQGERPPGSGFHGLPRRGKVDPLPRDVKLRVRKVGDVEVSTHVPVSRADPSVQSDERDPEDQ